MKNVILGENLKNSALPCSPLLWGTKPPVVKLHKLYHRGEQEETLSAIIDY